MNEGRARNHLLWIGPALTLAGALSYFAFFARFAPLRDFPWVNLPLVLAGLALTVLAAVRPWRAPARFKGKILGVVALLVSGILAAGFVFYVFGMSYWVPAPTTLSESLERAPDVELTSQDGAPVRLSDWRGRKVVLVFYRGYW